MICLDIDVFQTFNPSGKSEQNLIHMHKSSVVSDVSDYRDSPYRFDIYVVTQIETFQHNNRASLTIFHL